MNKFSKNLIKKGNKVRKFLEKELKTLEEELAGFQINQFYLECKQKLEKSYAKEINGIRVMVREWGKFYKVFLNLEK